jgi:hypothetical protein
VEQSTEPTSQLLVGVHEAPWAHDTQAPLLQTSFTPHAVPLDAVIPVSVHEGGVAVQSRVPVSHGLALGAHAAPAVHAPHAPFSQTIPAPHCMPSRTFTPVSVQRGTPVEQSVAPTWQAFVGVQAAPAVQGVHAPAWQTSLVPQVVPFVAFVPVSLHWAVPVVQSIVPV